VADPLPKPIASQLRTAAETIRDTVEAWSVNWRKGKTIVHAGKPTLKFLMEQGRQAPRSIITAQRAESSLHAFGKDVLADVTWTWFLVLPGRIDDRVLNALTLVDHAMRFASASPWSSMAPDCPFAKKPEGGRTEFRNLYTDADERKGMSIWVVQWEQQIDLGSALIPSDPLGQPLTLIDITSTVAGDPNPDKIETQVT
jgi:hypothetical protein